jgi:hypothetical protein
MPALFVSDLPAVSPPTLAPAVMRAGVLFGTAPADCLQPDWREHDINCEMARGVFEDIFANEWDDNGRGEHEDRFVRVGMVENACCSSLTPFEGRVFGSSRPDRRNGRAPRHLRGHGTV